LYLASLRNAIVP